MLERLFILVAVLSGLFFLFRKVINNKPQKTNTLVEIFKGVQGINYDLPTVLYFWSEQCTQCYSLQNPVLSKLKQQFNNFNLVSFNALSEDLIVKKLNIRTVPATAIISSGQSEVKFVNNGYVGEELLLSQLKEISS